jgi:hypothetical protein
MNSIAAFQMARALDEERIRYVEKRRDARRERSASAQADGTFGGGQSWRGILRFPRFTAAASKG